MSLENFVPEVIFMDSLEPSIKFLAEGENSSSQNDYSSKENFSNLNFQVKHSLDGLPLNVTAKEQNANFNSFQEQLSENSYFKDQSSQGIEKNVGENSQNSALDEANSYTGHSNFKLEWDSESGALYIVIPSVDSLDHWMMLFLQPLGITCDSLSIDNCCLKRNCDFRIRLDDERLLLYPDLLKDISDFINIQLMNWQYYKESVILRGSEMVCSENDENSKNSTEMDDHVNNVCYNYWKFPDFNVSVNYHSQVENSISHLRDENLSKYYDKENHSQSINGFDKSAQSSITKYDTEKVYRRCILVPELCPKGDDSSVQSNTLSCLTTNISDLNALTTDSGVLQVLTSENSSHEENYFALNSSKSIGSNEKEYFPIEAWSIKNE